MANKSGSFGLSKEEKERFNQVKEQKNATQVQKGNYGLTGSDKEAFNRVMATKGEGLENAYQAVGDSLKYVQNNLSNPEAKGNDLRMQAEQLALANRYLSNYAAATGNQYDGKGIEDLARSAADHALRLSNPEYRTYIDLMNTDIGKLDSEITGLQNSINDNPASQKGYGFMSVVAPLVTRNTGISAGAFNEQAVSNRERLSEDKQALAAKQEKRDAAYRLQNGLPSAEQEAANAALEQMNAEQKRLKNLDITATMKQIDDIDRQISELSNGNVADWAARNLLGNSVIPFGRDARADAYTVQDLKKQKAQLEADLAKAQTAQMSGNADYTQNSMYTPSRYASYGELRSDLGNEQYSDMQTLDLLYDYVNNNVSEYVRRDYERGERSGYGYAPAKYMTDEQRGTFNYIWNTQGKDAAVRYFEGIRPTLNAQGAAQQAEETAKRTAGGDGIGSEIFNSINSVGLAASRQPFDYIRMVQDKLFSDTGEIDVNDPKYWATREKNAIRNTVTQEIAQKGGAWEKWGTFGYGTAMSMADFITQYAVSAGVSNLLGAALGTTASSMFNNAAGEMMGINANTGLLQNMEGTAQMKAAENLSLGIMGSDAAADTVMEKIKEGVPQEQAFMLGTVAGIAEIVSERISIEALFNEASLGKDRVYYFLKNALAEGGEEVESDFINAFADIIIMGDKGEWAQKLREYEKLYDRKTAFGKCVADFAQEAGMDALGGFISGGVMAAGSIAKDAIRNRAAGNYITNGMSDDRVRSLAQSVVDEAKNQRQMRDGELYVANDAAYANANRLQKQILKDRVTKEQLGRTYRYNTETAQRNIIARSGVERAASSYDRYYEAATGEKLTEEQRNRNTAEVEARMRSNGAEQFATINESIPGHEQGSTVRVGGIDVDEDGAVTVNVAGTDEYLSLGEVTLDPKMQTLVDTAKTIKNADARNNLIAEYFSSNMSQNVAQYSLAYEALFRNAENMGRDAGIQSIVQAANAETHLDVESILSPETVSSAVGIAVDPTMRTRAKDGNYGVINLRTAGQLGGKNIMERGDIKALDTVGKEMGLRINLVDNIYIDKSGEGHVKYFGIDEITGMANASFDTHTGEFFIAKGRKDGIAIEGAEMLFFMHESGHMLRLENPSAFNRLLDITIRMNDGDISKWERLEAHKEMRAYDEYRPLFEKGREAELEKATEEWLDKRTEEGTNRDRMDEEIVCNTLPGILETQESRHELLNKLLKEKRTVREKILQFFKSIRDMFDKAYKALTKSGSYSEARVAQKNADLLNEFIEVYAEAINAIGEAGTSESAVGMKMSKTDSEYMALANKGEENLTADEKNTLRKMVDRSVLRAGAMSRNGEPTHYYHGTTMDFNSFDNNRPSKHGRMLGNGTYLTDDENYAKQYIKGNGEGRVIDSFVIADKMATTDSRTISKRSFERLIKDINKKGYDFNAKSVWFESTRTHADDANILASAEAILEKRINKDVNSFLQTFSDCVSNRFGYHGLYFKDVNEIVVWDNRRVKSADLITYDNEGNVIPLTVRFKTDRTGTESWKNTDIRFSRIDAPTTAEEANEAQVRYSKIDADWSNVSYTDKDKVRRDFETGNVTVSYRAMQKVGDVFLSPMAAVINGEKVDGLRPGDIVVTDENPNLAYYKVQDKDGKYPNKEGSVIAGKQYKKGDPVLDEHTGDIAYFFKLVKGEKDDFGETQTNIPARYNPYIHSSLGMINDQFSSAWKRGNIVIVKVLVPNSDIESGYRADKAKNASGRTTWKDGVVSKQLAKAGKQREVILSRFCKIVGEVSDQEVARYYAAQLDGTGITIPYNTVPSHLRDALVKEGVRISAPENNSAGKASIPYYEAWKNGGQKMSRADIEGMEAERASLISEHSSLNSEIREIRSDIKRIESSEEYRKIIDEAYKNNDYDKAGSYISDSGLEGMYDRVKELNDRIAELQTRENDLYVKIAKSKEIEEIEKSGGTEKEYRVKRAIKEFGYTPYYYDAGYMLPNGKLLNFSGEKGRHFGTRGQDHRGISAIYAEQYKSATAYMTAFMNDGNIRIMDETPGIDISNATELTAAQYSGIRSYARTKLADDSFSVDFSDNNGNNIGYIEYEKGASADRVVNDIKRFFATGKVPEADTISMFHTKYSIQDSALTDEMRAELDNTAVTGLNVNNDGPVPYADKLSDGSKVEETRETPIKYIGEDGHYHELKVGDRVGFVSTGRKGKGMLTAYATVKEIIEYNTYEEFHSAEAQARHLVPKGSKYDFKAGGKKYGYVFENVTKLETPIPTIWNGPSATRKMDVKYSRADDIPYEARKSMSAYRAEQMFDSAFAKNNLRAFYEDNGESYRNGKQWVAGESAQEVALYLENDYDIYANFLQKLPGFGDSFVTEDIVNAYKEGLLDGQRKRSTVKNSSSNVITKQEADRFMELAKKSDLTEEETKEATRIRDKQAEVNGYHPLRELFHGTLNGGWNVFDRAHAHVHGNSGAGLYTTTNIDDALNNYTDKEGADNYFKACALAETMRDSGDEEWSSLSWDDAVEKAKKELNKNPQLYRLFAKTDRPYYRDFKNSTNIYDDLMEEIEFPYTEDDFDSEDDYEDEKYDYISNAVTLKIRDAVYGAFSDLGDAYDIVSGSDETEVVNDIAEAAIDGVLQWRDLTDAFGTAGVEVTKYDWTQSADATTELARLFLENLGYDSIIDREVSTKFNQLKNMKANGTEHVIVFKPEQLKMSALFTYDDKHNPIPITERYNDKVQDIRYSRTDDSFDYMDEILTESRRNLEKENASLRNQVKDLMQELINSRGLHYTEESVRTPLKDILDQYSVDGKKLKTYTDELKKTMEYYAGKMANGEDVFNEYTRSLDNLADKMLDDVLITPNAEQIEMDKDNVAWLKQYFNGRKFKVNQDIIESCGAETVAGLRGKFMKYGISMVFVTKNYGDAVDIDADRDEFRPELIGRGIINGSDYLRSETSQMELADILKYLEQANARKNDISRGYDPAAFDGVSREDMRADLSIDLLNVAIAGEQQTADEYAKLQQNKAVSKARAEERAKTDKAVKEAVSDVTRKYERLLDATAEQADHARKVYAAEAEHARQVMYDWHELDIARVEDKITSLKAEAHQLREDAKKIKNKPRRDQKLAQARKIDADVSELMKVRDALKRTIAKRSKTASYDRRTVINAEREIAAAVQRAASEGYGFGAAEQKLADDIYFGQQAEQQRQRTEAQLAAKDAEARAEKKEMLKEQKHLIKTEQVTAAWDVAEQRRTDDMYYARKLHELAERYRGLMADRAEKVKDREVRQKLRGQIMARVKTLTKMVTSPTDAKHVPEVVRPLVEEFTRIFASDNKGVFYGDRLASLERLYGRLNNTDMEIADSAQAMKDMFDEDTLNDIIDIETMLNGKRLSDLTKDELKKLSDITNSIYHMARHADDIRLNGRRENREKLGEAWIKEAQDSGNRKNNILTKAYDILGMQNMLPIYFFRNMGGTAEALFNDIDEGMRGYTNMLVDIKRKQEELQSKYKRDEWAHKKNDTIAIDTSDGKIELTRMEALSIYATYMRELTSGQGSKHLLEGGIVMDAEARGAKNDAALTTIAHHIGEDTIHKVIEWLTPEQRQYADAVVKYMSTDLSEAGNNVTMQMYGVKKFGEAYYFPFSVSRSYLAQSADKVGMEQAQLMRKAGWTKRTQKGANAPIVIRSFDDIAAGHMQQMAMYANLFVPLDNVERILNYKQGFNEQTGSVGESVHGAISAAWGQDAEQYIYRFLRDLNGNVSKDYSESVADRLTSAFKKNAVLANLSVVVQQPSAIVRSMIYIDPKYFLRKAPGDGASYEELKKYSYTAVIKEIGGFDMGHGTGHAQWLSADKRRSSGYDRFQETIGDIGGYLPGKADELTWGRMWSAVKAETAAKHPELTGEALLDAAGRRFDEVMNLTQVYDSTFSRSANMRSKTGLMKMITAFMAEPTVSYNILMNAAMKVKEQGFKNAKGFVARSVGAYAGATLLNALLKSLVGAARDDDKDKTYLEKYLQKVVENFSDDINPLTLIPIVKDALSIWQGYDVARSDTAVFSEIKDAYNVLKSDGKSAYDKIKAAAGAIGIVTGVPVKNVMRDMEAMFNIFFSSLSMSEENEQGIRMALSDALADSFPFSLWIKNSATDMGNKMVKAYARGDVDEAQRVITDYQFRQKRKYGDDAKKIQSNTASWMKKAIKAAYLDDRIDYTTAQKMLSSIVGMTDTKSIYKTIEGWEDAKLAEDEEYEGTAGVYGELFDAARSGNASAYNARVKEMTANGYTESDIKTQMSKQVGAWYKGTAEDGSAKISKGEAVSMLQRYAGKTAEEAQGQVGRWTANITYGIDYDDADDYYLSGEETPNGIIIDRSRLKTIFKSCGGLTEEQAEKKVRQLEYEKKYPELSQMFSAQQIGTVLEQYEENAKPAGISMEMFADWYDFQSQQHADVDTNGNPIDGTKKAKLVAYINSLPISAAQKDALYLSEYVPSGLKNTPWH